jgi:hypothetical protein
MKLARLLGPRERREHADLRGYARSCKRPRARGGDMARPILPSRLDYSKKLADVDAPVSSSNGRRPAVR